MEATKIALKASTIAPVGSILVIAITDLLDGKAQNGQLISYSTVAVAALIFLFLSSLCLSLLILQITKQNLQSKRTNLISALGYFLTILACILSSSETRRLKLIKYLSQIKNYTLITRKDLLVTVLRKRSISLTVLILMILSSSLLVVK